MMDIKPVRTGNGRMKQPAAPDDIPAPGFRFVRRFLLLILLTVGLLVCAMGLLGWYAEMDVTVAGQGTAEPTDRHRVKAALGGIVEAVHVRQWQQVSAGDRIATLDRSEWEAELMKLDMDMEINRSRKMEIAHQMRQERDILQTEVRRASAELEVLTLQLDRIRQEYGLYYAAFKPAENRPQTPVGGLLPVRLQAAMRRRALADLDRAESRLRAVGNRRREIRTLDKQREKLAQERRFLEDRLARSVIRAPRAGTVLTGDLGRRAGDRIQPGEALLELAALDGWQARVRVQEADIPRVKPGQSVRLYVDAFPHMEYRIFDGVVEKVSAKPASDAIPPPAPLYPVTVSIRNPVATDGERTYTLTYGMRVEAKIVVDRGRIADLLWRKLLRTAGKLKH